MDGQYHDHVHTSHIFIPDLDPSWLLDDLSDDDFCSNSSANASFPFLRNHPATNTTNNNNPNGLSLDDETQYLPINVASSLAAGTLHHQQYHNNNKHLFPSDPIDPNNPQIILTEQQKLRLLDEEWTELALQQFVQDGSINKNTIDKDNKS